MVLDERARHELFLRLEQVLGPESAETLMEMLPPVGWADVATKRDLDALEQRMDLRFEVVDQRFGRLEERFEGLEQRFEGLEQQVGQRFDLLGQSLDQRFDLLGQLLDQRFQTAEHKFLGAFRGELLATVTAQTRTLTMVNLGAVLSVAALAFGATRLT
jgi:hypothetical protein